ncbi:alpha-amylase [Ictalurus punctatus]|uniref:Alpha-amylase n=1 Tax=Ictalurus punctatus TaxID=7998 RepID=A0A2D0R4B8_ICTPU|nr:alpha-amylase [Ictalurus punctatus]
MVRWCLDPLLLLQHREISPPSEQIVVSKASRPVSCWLCSRSGTEQELGEVISRCNHVKICADVVIHHTCASDTVEDRLSTRGSYFTATREEFPSVPFPSADFNDDECTSGGGNIENYRDIYQL